MSFMGGCRTDGGGLTWEYMWLLLREIKDNRIFTGSDKNKSLSLDYTGKLFFFFLGMIQMNES